MTKHYDRQGAEDQARRDAINRGGVRIVSPGFEGRIRPGGQWLNLSPAEYARMNVLPAVTRFFDHGGSEDLTGGVK